MLNKGTAKNPLFYVTLIIMLNGYEVLFHSGHSSYTLTKFKSPAHPATTASLPYTSVSLLPPCQVPPDKDER